MKVDVRDREVLQSLVPVEVAAYLRSRGWHELSGTARDWTVFKLGNEYDVILPWSTGLIDFARRMLEILRTLEDVEKRDQLEILADLSLAAADVIRVRVADSDAHDGSLPFARAVDVIARSYDMLLAAACAAVEARYYYPSRKPQQAADYMHGVRMGQTERGSFTVTILSRVTPAPAQASQTGCDAEPFERKVTKQLASALTAISAAAKSAVAKNDIDPFEAAVAHGVSANLCDAIAAMSEPGGIPGDLQISLSWAPVRVTGEPAIHFEAHRDMVPKLREVARVFKSRDLARISSGA